MAVRIEKSDVLPFERLSPYFKHSQKRQTEICKQTLRSNFSDLVPGGFSSKTFFMAKTTKVIFHECENGMILLQLIELFIA